MTAPTLSPRAWLDVIERDYLMDFIRHGGAGVKVAVVAPEQSGGLASELVETGRRHGFVTALVDDSVPRVYYMDRLFNAIAAQVDWPALAFDFMSSLLRSHGYSLPEGTLTVDRVARANSIDPQQVQMTVERALTASVLGDRVMARDFRLAMNQLCRAAVEQDDIQLEQAGLVQAWLRGELHAIGSLSRGIGIFERINRYNARAMLTSAAEWVRLAGRSGLLVVIDVGRFAIARPSPGPDGTALRPPSRTAVLDTYELMRQCLDGADEVSGLLTVFLAGPELVEDERRGMRAYPALELRLTDDVRDRDRPNPYAPMVRISWS